MSTSYGSLKTFEESRQGSNTLKDPSTECSKTEITLEQALENAGFKTRHVLCLLALCVVVSGIYSQLEANVLLGPELLCEWNLSGAEEAFITSSLSFGCAFGSLAWGQVGDKSGISVTLLL